MYVMFTPQQGCKVFYEQPGEIMSVTCSCPVERCSFLQSNNLIRKTDDGTSFSKLHTFQALKEMGVTA